MAIQWNGRIRDDGFVTRMTSVVIVSAIISATCSYAIFRMQAPPATRPSTGAIVKLQSEVAGLEESLRSQIAETAALRREMAVLTSDNGIIARLVGHVKTLREQNHMLSEIVARSGNTTPDTDDRYPANSLASSGMDGGAAITGQNVSSPTRLMVVTPTKKTEPGPEPAPARKTRAQEPPKSETKDGA